LVGIFPKIKPSLLFSPDGSVIPSRLGFLDETKWNIADSRNPYLEVNPIYSLLDIFYTFITPSKIEHIQC
jgi:hypothetical protein